MSDVAGGDVEVTPLAKTTEQGAPAPEKIAGGREVVELCPFWCDELPKIGWKDHSKTATGTRLHVIISARTVERTSFQINTAPLNI